MARIFLSHSSADEREAVAIKHWLADNGWDDVFLDIDPQRGLAAGERWQEALRQAADRCEAVVFIVSPAWAQSKWCLAEFLLAKSLHKQIFGVVLKDVPIGELPTEMTSEWQLCLLVGTGPSDTIRFRYRDADDSVTFVREGLGRLKAGLQKAGLSADFFPWPPKDDPRRSPFRGLEPLDFEDAAVFFGRDLEILRGLDVLRGLRDNPATRLFVILAASGTGKSSFLRAGLLPRLARDDRHFLPLGVVRPETAAISGDRGLAQALAQTMKKLGVSGSNPGELKTRLTAGAGEFASILSAIQEAACTRLVGGQGESRPPAPTLVLPVDQAEELFSPDAGPEARKFLSLIAAIQRDSQRPAVASSPAVPLIVAFTIRSDRYEPLQTAPELDGLQTTVFDHLKPMPATRFREVITGPARRASVDAGRLEIKPDLLDRLVEDCSTGADTLPLLSLTLERLYHDFGSDGDLRLDEYVALGGLGNIIKNKIESVLDRDGERRKHQLELLRSAFIPWLVTINPQNDEPMRRMARHSDLPADSLPLIDALTENRLLTRDQRNGETVIEVAHETLLRQWDVLAGWLHADREHLRIRARVEQAQALWERDNPEPARRDPSLLLPQGLPLEEARALLPTARPRTATVDYIRASIAYHEAAVLRRYRIRRIVITALTLFLVTAILTATWALSKQAQANRLTLEQAKHLEAASWAEFNQAQRHFDEATNAASDGVRRAKTTEGLLYLARAIRFNPQNRTARELFGWQTILRRDVLPNLPEATLQDEEPLFHIAHASFSPDGSRVVTANEWDRTAKLWDAATGKALATLAHDLPVNHASFSPDGSRLLTVSGQLGEPGAAKLWNATTGEALATLPHENEVNHASFSRDGSRVVTASGDYKSPGVAKIWDVTTGKTLATLPHDNKVNHASFSPDGRRVVTASHDETAKLWDTATGKMLVTLPHDSYVLQASFSPDGSRVVTASSDKTAKLWEAATGKLLATLRHEDLVEEASFSPDGTRVVTASSDDTAKLWDVATGEALATLPDESDVKYASFSPDGCRVLTASSNESGAAKLWETATGKKLATLTSDRSWGQPSFSPDGSRVVTISWNKVELWGAAINVAMLRLEHNDPVNHASFSPDGSRVVTASGNSHESGVAKLWDAATGRMLATLSHEKRVNQANFSRDGSRIVTASDDGTAKLWDRTGGKPLATLAHDGGVNHASFSPDGSRVVTASDDKTAKLWDGATGRALVTLPHDDRVNFVSFSRDGGRVVTASDDKTAKVWEVATGKTLATLRHDEPVHCANFDESGNRVVTGNGLRPNGVMRIWDAATDKVLVKETHGLSVNQANFSTDGRRVVTASDDSTAKVLDAATGNVLATLRHNAGVNHAFFNPDGSRVLTASGNFIQRPGMAKLWEAATGRALATFSHDNGMVRYAIFGADGTRIVTVGDDNAAKAWDLSTGRSLGDEDGSVSSYVALAEYLSGKRLSEDGDLRTLSDAERIEVQTQIVDLAATHSAVGKLARWLTATGPEVPVMPAGAPSRRDRVEALLANNTEDEVREAYCLWPTHPLIHIALAAHEHAPGGRGQSDAQRQAAKKAASTRAEFLREYGLHHLPDDATTCARAAAMFAEQEDFARAAEATDKALKLDSKSVSALQTRLTALKRLGRTADAAELLKQHPELQPNAGAK